MRPSAPIAAGGVVPAPREAVFAFLAELDNHWLVADRWIDVVRLDGDGDGGRVRIHGPLGLRRTTQTRVLRAEPPAILEGSATLGRTVARVRWELSQHHHATLVRLEAEVEQAGPLDRLLLAAGGRRWLRRRFGATVVTLARCFAERASRSGGPPPPAPREAWTARA
jgi:Polyketide cyclase / dehydrase and lipid transport